MYRLARRGIPAALLFCLGIAACGSDESGEDYAVYEADNTQQCSTQVVEGLDVYSGDGTINWNEVAASGRDFVFIKATQGNYNKQTNFATNWAGAQAAGVLRSPYHFFDATIDGVTQANWYLAELATVGGLNDGDLPPMLDLECPTSSNQANTEANCEYTGNSGWVATAMLSQRVFDWLTTVQHATGRTPIIYSYASWFGDAALTDSRLAAYPLYIASYNTCASVPLPWTSAVFWQYSSTATVPGVQSQTDVDRFFGTKQELMALTVAPMSDAGPITVDAAGVHPDGGVMNSDAGMMPPGNSGCGCRSSTDVSSGEATMALVLGIGVGAKRRRRRFANPSATH